MVVGCFVVVACHQWGMVGLLGRAQGTVGQHAPNMLWLLIVAMTRVARLARSAPKLSARK